MMRAPQEPTVRLPVSGFLWMIGFHAGFFFTEILAIGRLLPQMRRMFEEFGIELPMIAKFVFLLDISSLVLFAIAHAAAIGIYAILTFKSSIWTNVWGFGTVAIGLGMLMIAGFGVAIPYWDLVHGLTNVK